MDIIGIAVNVSLLHFIAKPLLMPLLFVLLRLNITTTPRKNLLLAGLFFSWCGDVLLLFDASNQLFFIFGLACFLITHLLYIIYFLKISSAGISLLKKWPLLTIAVMGYTLTLVIMLFPHLGDLKIPVIIYAAVICTMLLCSLRVFLKVIVPANRYFLSGAVLFVISDSILAINKFYQPFAYAAVLIMLSYCIAQYFIVTGCIKQLAHD
jgi:uncharacterized membrane protein YhhN